MQGLDDFPLVLARERVNADLPLAQPRMQERVDAVLPIVAEQVFCGRVRQATAFDEEVERRAVKSS